MKVAWLWTDRLQGSRYKYRKMFERLCEVRLINKAKSRIKKCDIAVAFGDGHQSYKLAVKANRPYILIQHDTRAMRVDGEGIEHELEMVGGAKSVIFASEDHRDWLAERMELPPHEVIHLKPLLQDLCFEPLPKKPNTIVYVGGLQPESRRDDPIGYRVYHDIFSELIMGGWEVHVYPALSNRKDVVQEYKNLGCIMHDSVPQNEIYREISQFEVGLNAYGLDGSQFYVHSCRPNKLREYLGAGIPTVGFNVGKMGDIYHGKWGLVADSLESLPDVAGEASKMEIDLSLRMSESLDMDIGKFKRILEA